MLAATALPREVAGAEKAKVRSQYLRTFWANHAGVGEARRKRVSPMWGRKSRNPPFSARRERDRAVAAIRVCPMRA
jgi:hypothetical protein